MKHKLIAILSGVIILSGCVNPNLKNFQMPTTDSGKIVEQEIENKNENKKIDIKMATDTPNENKEAEIITETEVPKISEEPTKTEEPIEEVTETEETTEAEETTETEEVTQTEIPITTENNEVEKIKVSTPDNVTSPYTGTYGNPFDKDGNLSNKTMGWYFVKNDNHQPPTADRTFDIKAYDGYYLGDINQKVVYLTFDEGYENGYTSQILDVLKEKGVHAAFFVTLPYMKSSPDLINRMANEGHLVVNHSVRHLSSPTLSSEELKKELDDTASYYNELTGFTMAKFFRPPMGEYSAKSLNTTKENGYKTIFWSFAYKDWLVDAQPGKDVAYKAVMDNLHNGEILLLHAVSDSNTKALPDIIDSVIESGYTFASLEDIN